MFPLGFELLAPIRGRHGIRLNRTILVVPLLCAFASQSVCADSSGSTHRPNKAHLELIVLGSGGPRAFGRGATSYAVLVDGTPRILVDAGAGAFIESGKLGLDFDHLDIVLLTHLHIDHT